MKRPVRLTLYSAPGCHLCHAMEAVVREAAAVRRLELRVIDISTSQELERAWRPEIPVLFIEGRKAFKYRTVLGPLLEKIDAAT